MAKQGIILTNSQLGALEEACQENVVRRGIKIEHHGNRGARDLPIATCMLGMIKGAYRILSAHLLVHEKKLYRPSKELWTAFPAWLECYNRECPHYAL